MTVNNHFTTKNSLIRDLQKEIPKLNKDIDFDSLYTIRGNSITNNRTKEAFKFEGKVINPVIFDFTTIRDFLQFEESI